MIGSQVFKIKGKHGIYSHSIKSQVKITKYINKIMMLMMTEELILAFFVSSLSFTVKSVNGMQSWCITDLLIALSRRRRLNYEGRSSTRSD